MIMDLTQFLIQPHPNSNAQSRDLKTCLQLCMVAQQLSNTNSMTKNRHTVRELGNRYITDLDLMDAVIRRSDQLYKMWVVQTILPHHLPSPPTLFTSEQPFLKTALRPLPSNAQARYQSALMSIQQGNWDVALETLADPETEWMAHIIHSLAPLHEGDSRDRCSLDIMRAPKFGNGNPRWLLTLQTLASVQLKDREQMIVSWLLARPKSFISQLNDSNWYLGLLSQIRHELHYKALKQLLLLKQQNPNCTYFGWSQDFELNQGDSQVNYQVIFQNIFRDETVPDFQSILNQDIFRNLDRQSPMDYLLSVGKLVQVKLISSQKNDLLDYIMKMVKVLKQTQLDTINLEYRLRLYYEWAQLSYTINPKQSQPIIIEAIDCIGMEMSPECDGQWGGVQENALHMIQLLLIQVDDVAMVQNKFAQVFSQSPYLERLAGFIQNLRLSEEQEIDTLLLLFNGMEFTSNKIIDTIKLLQEVGSHRSPSLRLCTYTELLLQILSRYEPKPRKVKKSYKLSFEMLEPLLQYINHVENLENSISYSLARIVEAYFQMKESKSFIDITGTLIGLFRLQDGQLRQIQEIWTYKLLKLAVKYARAYEDRYSKHLLILTRNILSGLFDILMMGDYLQRVRNLKILLSLIPFENDDQFLTYVFQ